MLLVEQSSVSGAVLPVAELKNHLMLGTGFADDGAQDVLLEAYLQAAIAAIEARTGKVLLNKSYRMTLTAWREAQRQPLPVAPVSSVDAVRVVDGMGQASVIGAAQYRFQPDMHRPVLLGTTSALPVIANDGTAEVDFVAGYGRAWSNIPKDLGQAALLLAAHYYENRAAAGSDVGFPIGVSGLLEPYRELRLSAGGRA